MGPSLAAAGHLQALGMNAALDVSFLPVQARRSGLDERARKEAQPTTPDDLDEDARIALGVLERMGVAYSLKTKSLHTVVTALVKNHRPMKLVDMAKLPGVRDLSLTSVYRLTSKLDEARMFRRLGGDARCFSYMLIIPGRLQHYLTCTVCGTICEFTTSDSMTCLRNDVESSTSWSDVRFELELFGRCPECREA